MANKEKMVELFQSGRYQFDIWFYNSLIASLKELNLYHLLPKLDQNYAIITKIQKLTDANCKSLEEDYDEELGRHQTELIRQEILKLNITDVGLLMNECILMNWESYQSKTQRLLISIKHQPYFQIASRIKNTIHNDQTRIDNILTVGLFALIHRSSLEQSLHQYSESIEFWLKQFSNARSSIQLINDYSATTNIASLTKIRNYVGGICLILRVLLRFCEILKIFTGQSNLSLKFTIFKKELYKLEKQHPEWKIPKENQDSSADLEEFRVFLRNPSTYKFIHPTCTICLHKNTHSNSSKHELCERVLKCKI